MTRQPTAARVLRWLLVLATVAGFGLWQGAPAPGPMAAAPAGQHLDECHIVRAAAAGPAVSVRLPQTTAVRTVTTAAAPEPVPARTVPALSLTTIGVCRT